MAYRFSYTPGQLLGMILRSKVNRYFKIIGVWSGFPGGVQKIELQEIDTEKITPIKLDDFKKYVEEKDEQGVALLTRI